MRTIGKLIIVGLFLVFVAFVALKGYSWQKTRKTPQQPIQFSHEIHVKKVGLQCQFCHTTVEKSTFAGIPSVQKCMTCHEKVATDRPEIQKLTRFWKDGQPIPWNRVYRIPVRNHVYFSHKRHVRAGVECRTCHGNVEVMPVIKRQRELQMGWCVSCHRANNAPDDCLTCHK